MFEISLKCSECGKEFTIPYAAGYSYRVSVNSTTASKLPKDSIYGSKSYQCSYTCNDHALLRVSYRMGHMTRENLERYVKRSEESIRSKGKEVRFPIDLSKVRLKK